MAMKMAHPRPGPEKKAGHAAQLLAPARPGRHRPRGPWMAWFGMKVDEAEKIHTELTAGRKSVRIASGVRVPFEVAAKVQRKEAWKAVERKLDELLLLETRGAASQEGCRRAAAAVWDAWMGIVSLDGMIMRSKSQEEKRRLFLEMKSASEKIRKIAAHGLPALTSSQSQGAR